MITPVPLAMVLCDTVIIDKRTDKKSLIGIFSNIGTVKFPFRSNHFAIYIALTDGHGEYKGHLICSDKDGTELFTTKGKIRFGTGAKTVVEMVYDIEGLLFPSEGIYTFSFYCNEELVITRECSVGLIKIQKKENG